MTPAALARYLHTYLPYLGMYLPYPQIARIVDDCSCWCHCADGHWATGLVWPCIEYTTVRETSHCGDGKYTGRCAGNVLYSPTSRDTLR